MKEIGQQKRWGKKGEGNGGKSPGSRDKAPMVRIRSRALRLEFPRAVCPVNARCNERTIALMNQAQRIIFARKKEK